MKRKLLLLLVLFVGIIFMTGCSKKNDPTAGFKNLKSIEYKTDKGKITLWYDDDGTYEVVKNDPYVTLKNADGNFRVDIDYSKNTTKSQEISKTNFAKDKNYTIIDNVKFRDYDGYIMIDNRYATAIAYLYLDKENDIINVKINLSFFNTFSLYIITEII